MDSAELLTTYLALRDVPCPSCGYNLRALLAPRCPECGLALSLRLQPATPRSGPFILGLVGLSAGLGFASLLLIFMVFRAYQQQHTPPLVEVAPLLGTLVLEGPFLLWWVLARRRTRRWRPGVAWSVAAGTCVLSIGLSAVFFLLIG